MGKRKITCNNNSCKHHINGGCDTCITLDGSGKCKSFEKGFAYYFHIVWDALDNKNFIDMVEIRMNPDLKTGLFYVMECYDLGFSEMEWGTCRMVMLKDGKEGKPLKYEEIIEREMNMEKFSKHLENFNNGIMPQMQQEQEQDAAGQQDKEEWRELRPVIMSVYEYVDIYALYVEHQLTTLKDSDPIHHIIELEEDWEQRLNPLNLIPLSHRTHNTITALYKQSNASMKATQTQLRSLIDYHFKEAGGYEKVLCDRFLVAPPLFFGENSPRENQDTGE